jgi:hypothetical protein
MGLEWLWSPGLETGPSLLLTIVHDDLRLVLNIKEKGLPSRERSGSPVQLPACPGDKRGWPVAILNARRCRHRRPAPQPKSVAGLPLFTIAAASLVRGQSNIRLTKLAESGGPLL